MGLGYGMGLGNEMGLGYRMVLGLGSWVLGCTVSTCSDAVVMQCVCVLMQY